MQYSQNQMKNKLKYQHIFEAAPIGIIYFDTKGVVTDCNLEATHIFSRSKQEFIGFNVLTQVKDPKLLQAVRKTLSEGSAIYADTYQHLLSNQKIDLYIKMQAIYNEIGMIEAGLALIQNMTAQKDTQRLLKRYKHMVNTSKEMMAFFDQSHHYLAANQAYLDFYDITLETLLGKKVEEMVPPNYKDKIKSALNKALQGEYFSGTIEYLKPGSYHTVIFEADFEPYHDGQEIAGVFLHIRDKTAQYQAEEKADFELKQSRRYFDLMPVMLLVLDEFANILNINAKGAAVLGYQPRDLIGENWIEICIPEALRADIHHVFEEVIQEETQTATYHENEVISKDGTLVKIAWHNTLIRDKRGKIIEILSSGEEITS